jgi:cytochrome P450
MSTSIETDFTAPPAPALYPPTVNPTPRPLPIWRFLPRFVANPLSSLPRQVYEEPVVTYETGRGSIAWITDPALIETVLLREHDRFPKTPLEHRVFRGALGNGILTSQGESWRWQRRIVAPLFRYNDIVSYVPDMVTAAEQRVAAWKASPPESVQSVDADMTDTTFTVIATTIFAGEALADSAVIQQASGAYLERISWEIAAAMMYLPVWLWHPAKPAMSRAARRLRETVGRMVERRRASGKAGSDLIGRLLAARDPETGLAMSDEQVIDNLLTFAAAGHETTAKALTWTLYLLARAPEWQARVRDEVGRVAGKAPISAGMIDELRVTQQVLKESMRLYPPAPVLTRVSAAPTELGGAAIRAGTLIVIPVFAVHRHRRLWPDPDRFDPERFAPEREVAYVRTQFMPFGFGPRICIGMSFATIEATAILATLVRGARFAWDGRHVPEPLSRVTLRPKGGMPLIVTAL